MNWQTALIGGFGICAGIGAVVLLYVLLVVCCWCSDQYIRWRAEK